MRSFVFILVALSFVSPARAGDEAEQHYVEHVKPILAARCYACHGALKQEGNLRLDTAAFALKGGDSGAVIEPSKVDSLLITRISAADESERMPPEGDPLKPAEIEAIKVWISQGAKGPADEHPERDPRDHWAFKTPVRPAIPSVDSLDWSRNPIDAFIEAERQNRGLQHQPAADKRVLLRRIYLDLIGLPPTRAQLDAFVANTAPDAYEKMVDELLESPQYGERWGRHWMDIWRYSDWWGLDAIEVRNSQRHIWHWREWIIESLNADKPYDQMLREMLAADELYPNDLDRLRATGYLARNYFLFNRTTWLDETIEHTSKAMLGMTVNCAKCHDHKYDPIAQTDYYRLRAVFEPYQLRTDLIPGESDFDRDGIPRAFDCNLDAKTFLHIRGNESRPDKDHPIEPGIPRVLSQANWKVEPVSLPQEAYQPALRPFVAANYLVTAERNIADARAKLDSSRHKLAELEAAGKSEQERVALQKPVTGASLVLDNFEVERPDLWEPQGGTWVYRGGKLVQSHDGAIRAAMRLKQAPPQNFEARLQFRATGGQIWKSVGIAFDTINSFESLAYVSAYLGGPKSQITYKNGDDYIYPPEAIQNRKFELNQPYELTVRVRDTLVNLLVNGDLSVAYRLPQARQAGSLQIVTFDATAEFTSFELKELAADVHVSEPSAPIKVTEPPASTTDAKLAVSLAEKALAAAESQPAAIRARDAAEKTRLLQDSANVLTLAQEASKLERLAVLAKAEEAVAQAELDAARAATDKKAEAEKKLVDARTAVDTARKDAETLSEKFTSLRGARKSVESNLETEESRSKPFPQTSTGRRSAFAKWLTDPKHPLTARVVVNHLWLRHFGRPLVPTVFDFGRKGTPPTHPGLLDWLATEMIEHGWSMKHLHRLMVTSQTYRMSSSSAGVAPETIASDPDNQYYWRMNPVRMQSQIVRDCLLSLAGELDLTRGGPPIPIASENSRRRSLYFIHSNKEHQKFLSMFDDASVLDCYRRAESIVPQQALALENSQLATAMGVKIAERIMAANSAASDREFIRDAFLTVLCVEPSEVELSLATEGLESLTNTAREQKHPQPAAQARINLIHALINHNDFVTVR